MWGVYTILSIQLFLWVFIVLMAPFHSRGLALINLKYLIPFMFILQVLPFDIFKLLFSQEEFDKGTDVFKKTLVLPKWFEQAKDFFAEYTQMNPLGPPALLIIASIISGYKE